VLVVLGKVLRRAEWFGGPGSMIISGLEILEERRTDEGLALVGKCGNELDLF